MDYKNQGQQGSQEQAFFTAGAGSISPDKNSFGAENNLDLSNQTASWSTETTEQPQELTANQTDTTTNETLSDQKSNNGLGETIDADLPPTMQALSTDSAPANPPVFNEKLILTRGDRIDKKALQETYKTIDKLEKDKNTADFYYLVRGDKNNPEDNPGLLGSNLDNSFNRKIA
ncbi:hypothetical protein IKF94_03460 [Candidatus Saccharibacteria bacterium]|nr:hypothetical protein [Candidatus Saccharibacteria bacterium]